MFTILLSYIHVQSVNHLSMQKAVEEVTSCAAYIDSMKTPDHPSVATETWYVVFSGGWP